MEIRKAGENMKHFKIIGPDTTRDFDIEDDEAIMWTVIKTKEFESKKIVTKCKEQNEVIKNNA